MLEQEQGASTSAGHPIGEARATRPLWPVPQVPAAPLYTNQLTSQRITALPSCSGGGSDGSSSSTGAIVGGVVGGMCGAGASGAQMRGPGCSCLLTMLGSDVLARIGCISSWTTEGPCGMLAAHFQLRGVTPGSCQPLPLQPC